jgi:hypothetical protein
MVALQVSVNGKHLYTIGAGTFGLLNAHVDWGRIETKSGQIREHLWVGARGIESGTENALDWQNIRLQVGDEVTITVVETDVCDEPLPGMPDFPASDV